MSEWERLVERLSPEALAEQEARATAKAKGYFEAVASGQLEPTPFMKMLMDRAQLR